VGGRCSRYNIRELSINKLVISIRMGSEAVEFDRGLGDALLSEEVGDLEALIALELDDLAKLFVVDQSPVACKILQ